MFAKISHTDFMPVRIRLTLIFFTINTNSTNLPMNQAKIEAEKLIKLFHEDGDKGLKKETTYIDFNCAKQCAIISINQSVKHLRRVDTIENMDELAHLRMMLICIEETPDKMA